MQSVLVIQAPDQVRAHWQRVTEMLRKQFPNAAPTWSAWTEPYGVRPVFAMEGTGSYGAGICRVLLDAAYDVIEVNRPDRSARRRQGKDDPEDAETAARAFLTGTASIVPKRGGDQVEMIHLLKVAKDSDIDGRTRALNQVRSLLVTAPMALRERLSGLSRNELITTCASFRPGELVGPQAAAKHALRSLARRIQALDAELKKLMADLDGLTQAACPGRRQSYGIGIDGGLSNKDILRCLKRFIAREVFHLLMGKPPRRTAAKNFARGLTIYGRICDSAPSLLSCSTTEHIGSSGLSR